MDNFIQADIYTSSEAIDGITYRLSDLGIDGFSVRDSADFKDFLADKNANWDYVDDSLMGLQNAEPCITVYVHDNAQGREQLNGIKLMVDEMKKQNSDGFFGNLRIELKNVKEEDWANNWKKYYKPFRVGRTLVVKPSWEDYTKNDGERILEIDPASTFGTGQHYTTKMVMEVLEDAVKGGERVLDLGCGSGILSIAALLFGAKEVTVCDIFENAVKTASENIEKNHFDKSRYTAFCGNIIDNESLRSDIGGGYDIVCANIVADVIIAMSGLFGQFMNRNAKLITSGIIDERFDEVMNALSENGFEVMHKKQEDGWCCAELKIS